MHEVHLLFSLLSQVGIWVVLLGTASAAAIAGEDDVKTSLTDHDSGHSSLGLWLGGAALGAVFCVVVVVLLSQCMDCYNSEVASESHPACGQSKSDYTPVSTSFHHNSHVQPGGAPPPDVRAPLPYSLNPTPSASSSPPPVGPGGLGAQQWGSQPQPTGPRGLGAQQWGSPSPPQPTAPPATPQQGRPYNGPEQPPSYFEATARGGRV